MASGRVPNNREDFEHEKSFTPYNPRSFETVGAKVTFN